MRQISRISALLLILPLITLIGVAPSQAVPGTKINTPNAPTVSAINSSATSINVSFSAPTNAPAGTQYTVKTYSSSDSGATYAVLSNTVNTTSRSLSVTGLAANTAYKVTATANGSGSFITSNESLQSLSVTTKPYLTQVVPTVQAVAGTVDSIRVSFSAVTNASSYSLQVYLDSNKATVDNPQTGFTSGSIVQVTLRQGTAYVVKVSAISTNNNFATSVSEFSSSVTTNAEAETPSTSTPESIRKNPGQSATFSVTASAADDGVLSYRWQRAVGSGAFADISGATQSTLTLDALLLSQNQNRFRIIVRNTLNGTYKESTSGIATLTVEISPENTLSSLSFTPGTISPNFSSSSTNYSVSISPTVTTLTVTASPVSEYATMSMNGSTLLPNTPSTVTVVTDPNFQPQTITITVTAEDSSTKTYSINVKIVSVTKTSTVVSPNVAPTPSASPVKPTKQVIQTPSASVLPKITSTSVNSGSFGSPVTINGTGFNSVLSVKLNGVNITPDPSAISSTSITVTIPAGARSGTIVVTTNKGSASTPRFTVTN